MHTLTNKQMKALLDHLREVKDTAEVFRVDHPFSASLIKLHADKAIACLRPEKPRAQGPDLDGEPTWQTNDGRFIPIKHMETSHIHNAIGTLSDNRTHYNLPHLEAELERRGEK